MAVGDDVDAGDSDGGFLNDWSGEGGCEEGTLSSFGDIL